MNKTNGIQEEVRSDSIAPVNVREVSEVTTAMNDLISVISRLQESVDQIELMLLPVLPEGYLKNGTPLSDDKHTSDYSCPLAMQIESEFVRVGYLETFIHDIVNNIKL